MNKSNTISTLNPLSLFRRLFPTARRLLVEKDIRQWCLNNNFSRVLVIGAGHDPYRSYFSEADIYIALDVIAFHGVTDVVADAVNLSFDDHVFDCVLAFEVMEHIATPFEFIEEAYRVLSPGGVLLLSVPFSFHQHGDPSDYWRPTRHALKIATSMFGEVDIIPQGNRLHSISDLITTAFYPRSILLPLRIINHFLVSVGPVAWLARMREGSAPSGFFVEARKGKSTTVEQFSCRG